MEPRNCVCGGSAVTEWVVGFGVFEDSCVYACEHEGCIIGPFKYTKKGAKTSWDRKIKALRRFSTEVVDSCPKCFYNDFCREYAIDERAPINSCVEVIAVYKCIKELEESIL